MAKKPQPSSSGNWQLLGELLERGDPTFVDELRRTTDADRLGELAARWYQDQRPTSRRLLLDYLNRPLNALRHEALVKRLFKLADKAGDDEVMAHFLVAFDRSVRRRQVRRHHYDYRTRRSYHEDALQVPSGTTMPRPTNPRPSSAYEKLRLFSVHTRNYLRRRAWRYFRKIGRKQPERYVSSVCTALRLYRDADVADGIALLDNWGLVHVLYHHCRAVLAKPNGWTLAEGYTLGDLEPDPMYLRLWRASATPLIELLKQDVCRPVRQWTIQLLKRDHAAALQNVPPDVLVSWLGHSAPEMVALAAELLRQSPLLRQLPLERWLQLLETPSPESLELICRLMTENFAAERVTIPQAVLLARRRIEALARMGFTWLQAKTPRTLEDCQALLLLREAEAEKLRPEFVRWARGVLSASSHFQPAWVLEFLDSRHADVRAEGWSWFQEDPRARDEVRLWQRLLESPYDEVRLPLIRALEERLAGWDRSKHLAELGNLDVELVRLLWASVLLNVQRGSKSKPGVVRQVLRRVLRHPQEANVLLPLLSVALRSARAPEWRSGLAGIVELVERNAEMEAPVRAAFPELELSPAMN